MVNLKGEPAYVGRHCGSNQYCVTPDLVDFYARALDDPSTPDGVAPPLLFHSECYRFLGDWYLSNLYGNLHARQEWHLFAPIPIGGEVRSRSTIVDRYTKRGRDYVVNETDLVAADDGRLLVRGRTHQSFLPPEQGPGSASAGGSASGAGGAGGSGGSGGFVVDERTAARKAPRPPFPTATGPDLKPVEKTVDQRRCWMFSGPGRNYHNDREEARKLGFPNIVVQGMMATCFVSQVLQQHFGRFAHHAPHPHDPHKGLGWVQGGRLDARLTNVLWVDEHVTAHAKVREETPEGTRTRVHCDVWVEKDDGTRILIGDASGLR